VEVDKNMS